MRSVPLKDMPEESPAPAWLPVPEEGVGEEGGGGGVWEAGVTCASGVTEDCPAAAEETALGAMLTVTPGGLLAARGENEDEGGVCPLGPWAAAGRPRGGGDPAWNSWGRQPCTAAPKATAQLSALTTEKKPISHLENARSPLTFPIG